MSNKKFTSFAHEKMMDLFNHHDHEVGSELYKEDPDKYKDHEKTNCITYVMNCMSYGFKMSGHPDAAQQVWKYIIRGVDLAGYLVHQHDWSCVYINPDVKHPRDENAEHPFSYNYDVKRRCTYYGLPVFATALNYHPTVETDSGIIYGAGEQTPLELDDIQKLEAVKFGFGLSRGGMHTWLFSEGQVYEVHWDGIGDSLYERSSIIEFPWLSSVIVVPPESARKLRESGINKCSR